MIPQNQRVMIRWVIVGHKIDKGAQGHCGAHVRVFLRPRYHARRLASGHVDDTVVGTGHVGIPPHAAARIQDQVRLGIIQSGRLHLAHIRAGASRIGLQIGPDHVDHDRIILRSCRKVRCYLVDHRVLRVEYLVFLSQLARIGVIGFIRSASVLAYPAGLLAFGAAFFSRPSRHAAAQKQHPNAQQRSDPYPVFFHMLIPFRVGRYKITKKTNYSISIR